MGNHIYGTEVPELLGTKIRRGQGPDKIRSSLTVVLVVVTIGSARILHNLA